jgi:hypothetical protein
VAAPTVTEIQRQIRALEGFDVSFASFDRKKAPLPAYGYSEMAPSRWTVADWIRMRLGAYVLIFRGVTVLRGDGTTAKSNLRLAALRDTYYYAKHGTLDPTEPDNLVRLVTS